MNHVLLQSVIGFVNAFSSACFLYIELLKLRCDIISHGDTEKKISKGHVSRILYDSDDCIVIVHFHLLDQNYEYLYTVTM